MAPPLGIPWRCCFPGQAGGLPVMAAGRCRRHILVSTGPRIGSLADHNPLKMYTSQAPWEAS
jgi:hypothetical protein